MKKMIKQIFFFSLLATIFISCKKDENRVLFEGGTAPVLTPSDYSSPLVLQLANQNDPGLALTWTNPGYKFNTGLSSQNVTYTLQIDTAGANFTNPKKVEISIANELSFNFTIGELNDALVGAGKLGLKDNMTHDIEMRIKSTMANETAPLYSNVITFEAVTLYPDPNVPTLWITGDGTASGWINNPPDAQKFTYISDLKFELLINFSPGGFYKFLTKYALWQPQYGGCGEAGGPLLVNPGAGTDPASIPTPAIPGLYKISVDLNAANPSCTVVLQ